MPPTTARATGDRSPPPFVRAAWVVAALALAVAVLLAPWVSRLSPAPLPEGAAMPAPVPCLSYAPFRRAGHTPFDPALVVSPAMIEADLALLRPLTGCVRTYGVDHGLDAVPEVAGRLGLRVALGAWIGRDQAANAVQVDRALALARAHPGVVDRLVIGNEVLLRRELPPDALAAWLAHARAQSPVPVTYADVWEFWRRHAAVLAPHVDLAAIHVLPYWEDGPVAVDRAVDHVHRIAQEMRQSLAPRPVWVAETGWPAAGRARGPAEASPQAQARFVRELLHREAREPLGFNLIEAFDQPWKRALEGPMGGAWGLLDAEGQLRVPLQGPAPPDPRARWVLGSAAVGGVLGLGIAWAIGLARGRGPARIRWHRHRSPSDLSVAAPGSGLGRAAAVAAVALALASALLALLASMQLQTLADGVRVGSDRPVLALAAGLSALVGGLGAWALARTLDGTPPRWTPFAQRLVGGHLFVAATLVLWSVFDGRYRALPGAFLAGPAVLAMALVALGLRWPQDGATAAAGRALAVVLGTAALALPFVDGLATGQVLATAVAAAALAAAVLWPTAADAGHAPASGPAPAARRGADPSCPQDPDAAAR